MSTPHQTCETTGRTTIILNAPFGSVDVLFSDELFATLRWKKGPRVVDVAPPIGLARIAIRVKSLFPLIKQITAEIPKQRTFLWISWPLIQGRRRFEVKLEKLSAETHRVVFVDTGKIGRCEICGGSGANMHLQPWYDSPQDIPADIPDSNAYIYSGPCTSCRGSGKGYVFVYHPPECIGLECPKCGAKLHEQRFRNHPDWETLGTVDSARIWKCCACEELVSDGLAYESWVNSKNSRRESDIDIFAGRLARSECVTCGKALSWFRRHILVATHCAKCQ